jgi:Ni,Fe-hydrogenase I small subunit
MAQTCSMHGVRSDAAGPCIGCAEEYWEKFNDRLTKLSAEEFASVASREEAALAAAVVEAVLECWEIDREYSDGKLSPEWDKAANALEALRAFREGRAK